MRNRVFLTHWAGMGVVAAIGLAGSMLPVEPERLVYPACVLVTAVITWTLVSWYAMRATLFEPYPLFLLAAGLFNGGQAVLEVGGLNRSGLLEGRVAPETLVAALYLVALGLMALHSGAMLRLSRHTARPERQSTGGSPAAVRAIGWALLGVSVVPWFALIRDQLSVVMQDGYFSLYGRAPSIGSPLFLAVFLVPGTLFLLAGGAAHRATRLTALALVALFAGFNLFMGMRGAGVMSVAAFAWLYHRRVRRIGRAKLAVAVAALGIALPLVRSMRDLSGAARLSADTYTQAAMSVDEALLDSIREMGGSMGTLTHTLALVPAIRDYDLGMSYWVAALTLVPNVGWEVHPSVAHGLLSDWLIRTVDPVIAARGGGLGFSFIAEAYLNFGWYGAAVLLGVLGYGVAAILLAADRPDAASQAFVASFLSFFLVFARAESATVARGLFWYSVLPYLACLALSRRSLSRRHATVPAGRIGAAEAC